MLLFELGVNWSWRSCLLDSWALCTEFIEDDVDVDVELEVELENVCRFVFRLEAMFAEICASLAEACAGSLRPRG